MRKSLLLSFIVALLSIILAVSCTDKPPTKIIENQPPNTYLVNVPQAPDTLDTTYIYHARIIYWYGIDSDGIVTRYDWAIDDTVYKENVAGSGWHSLYMDSTLATQDTIAFEAPLPDIIYTHIFYVRAVDNDDACDPTPATRVFKTDNIPPNTRFLSTPTDSSQRFILEDTTSRWRGINFQWTAIDSDMVLPAEFQYIWKAPGDPIPSMDDLDWSEPVETESYYFTGQNAPYTEGWHRVYVRAIDDAGAVDQCLSDTTISILEADTFYGPDSTTIDSIVIVDADTTIYNQWKTLYFVIPKIYEDPDYRSVLWANLVSNAYINNNIVKPFYHSILEDSINLSYDSLDYSSEEFDHIKLGDYSTVIWSRGDKDGSPSSLADEEDLFVDFFHIGGRIIFTGSALLKTGNYSENVSFGLDKPFPFSELHIEKYKNINAGTATDTSISPIESDTAFFSENSSYPHLPLNSSILWHPIIDNQVVAEILSLDLWGDYNGTLDIIYSLNHYRDNGEFERVPCGTKYTEEGTTIPTFFYLGFPMSYLEYGKATKLMRTILTDLEEIP
jgi:hypothetical protein